MKEKKATPTLKELVKNRMVQFAYYRSGVMYYKVSYELRSWVFPVPLDDVGNATLLCEDKAILYMRWIRKALAEGELIEVG